MASSTKKKIARKKIVVLKKERGNEKKLKLKIRWRPVYSKLVSRDFVSLGMALD
jgi:hypothetical protein